MRLAITSALVLAVAGMAACRDSGSDKQPSGTQPSASTRVAGGENWTKWRGAKGDSTTMEKGLAEQWPEAGPTVLWRKEVGQGYASPVAVDGKIYIFATAEGKDTLTCMDAEKGDVVWSQKNEKGYVEKQFPGTRATPTVDGDKIYTYGGHGDLVCREIKDGKEVWTLDLPKELEAKKPYWGAASCPTVIGDFVYLQVGEQAKGKAMPSLVVAVNKNTGKVAWQSEEKAPGSYAAVVQAEIGGKKQLLAFGANGLVGMDVETGKTQWKQEWKAEYGINAISPVVKDEYMFVTSGYKIGKGAMYKLDGTKAEKVWQKDEPRARLVPPLLEGDKLYVTNDEGSLMCLKWPGGEELWKQDLKLGTGGQYVRFGDKLIMMSNLGELMLVQATAEGCKQISKMQLFKGEENWSSPMVYRGRLYVKGMKELVCFDVKAVK